MIAATSFANETVAVFGLARSGIAAAHALQAGGADVRAWDDSENRRADAAANGVPLRNLYETDFAGVAALVLSPGVPLTHPAPHPVAARATAAGTEIVGDVELLLREDLPARLVGVTGTNGKSTTTALLAHILEACGRRAAAGANIGVPALDLPALDADGIYVLELSSYQIDLTPSLACDVAVLLNISPDHLDRHGGMEGYVAVKRRIFAHDKREGAAIVGIDDPHSAGIYEQLKASGHGNLVPIAVGKKVPGGVYVLAGQLFDAMDDGATVAAADLNEATSLRGVHNWQNAAAAYAAARALGLSRSEITAALPSFPGLAHRMEVVAAIDGVLYVNDSKATNAASAAYALAAFDNIYWIVGGRSKEDGITPVRPLFDRVRHAFLIGEAAQDFAETLEGRAPYTIAGDLAAALSAASDLASVDGADAPVVLLSPACASFDQFADFEARGDAFRTLVEALPGRRTVHQPHGIAKGGALD